MKKVLTVLLFLGTTAIFAQNGFGVKAGLNYADNGTIEYTDLTGAGENVIEENANRKTGYHFGVFYQANLGLLYVRPELLYTQTKSSYEHENADFNLSKLDLPILVGVNILGPVHIFAGPSLQYILDNDFDGATLEELNNDFTVGAQFGVGVQFGGIGIDARYEQALSENQAEFIGIDGDNGRLDSRPNQFILSLSLNL